MPGPGGRDMHAGKLGHYEEVTADMEQKVVAEYAAGTANTHAHQH